MHGVNSTEKKSLVCHGTRKDSIVYVVDLFFPATLVEFECVWVKNAVLHSLFNECYALCSLLTKIETWFIHHFLFSQSMAKNRHFLYQIKSLLLLILHYCDTGNK